MLCARIFFIPTFAKTILLNAIVTKNFGTERAHKIQGEEGIS